MGNVEKKENVNKNTETVIIDEYKKSFEMSKQEIDSLPKALCQIEKSISKKGIVFYNLIARLDGTNGNYKISFKKFDELKYNHFVRKNNLDPNIGRYVMKLPIRFINGININGNPYKQIQVFISDSATHEHFISYFDISEMEDLGYKAIFINRAERIDGEDITEF